MGTGASVDVESENRNYSRDSETKFKNIKYKLDDKKILELKNYLNGIRFLEKWRDFYFAVEGSIRIVNGFFVYSENLKFSKDKELNEKLIKGLEDRLKNLKN